MNADTFFFQDDFLNVLSQLETHDSTLTTLHTFFSYGTSGFRNNENLLDKIAFRIGIIGCLLSQCLNGMPIGIMITASHNIYTDNGFKIAFRNGEIVSPDMEYMFEEIVNSKSLAQDIQKFIQQLYLRKYATSKNFYVEFSPKIVYAIDTRRSSPALAKILATCFEIFPNCESKFYGVVTTPCLHFLTRLNQIMYHNIDEMSMSMSMSIPMQKKMNFADVAEYWKFLSKGITSFNNSFAKYSVQNNNNNNHVQCRYDNSLLIDCSFGVSSYVKDEIKDLVKDFLNVSFINDDYTICEKLNNKCGAEYLHQERMYPVNHPINGSEMDTYNIVKNISFDGDVDRIIYFISDSTGLKILDGDHLIIVLAQMLKSLISGLSRKIKEQFTSDISIGIVYTAYSSATFVEYVQNVLQFRLVIAKTGLKHLQEKARQFDIAIYFEANGHGTIHCNDTVQSKIGKLQSTVEISTDTQILELIQLYLSFFNPTTGDSLSVMSGVECALRSMNMSIYDMLTIFPRLESLNIKAKVRDKSIFKPNADETRLIAPEDCQRFIDEVNLKYFESNGRCFIRPSGTEDVVRIYAEARTIEEASEIGELVKSHLLDLYS